MSSKISARTAASTLTGAETLPCIQGGADRRTTVNLLLQRAGTYGAIRDGNCVADNSTDDTANLQAAITAAASAGKTLVLEDGSYKITTALTLPAAGIHIVGLGTGGNFQSVIRPYNCAAFNVDTVHHSTIEKVMIWIQGTAPPTSIISVQNSYSITFRDVRIEHAGAVSYVPSTAVIWQHGTGSSDILYERVVMRANIAVASYPKGFLFSASCGSAILIDPDIEVCDRGIQWLGGNITVHGIYTEACNPYTIEMAPDSDASASFVSYGGLINQPTGSYAYAVRDGTKNVSVNGQYVNVAGTGQQLYVYGLSVSSNVRFNFANFSNALVAGAVAFDPTIIKLDAPNRPLPASKDVTINVTAGTLSAGDITGAQVVRLLTTNASPGNQTTRTAVQMVADTVNCLPGDVYTVEIANTGAGTLTLLAGVGVTLTGTMTVATLTKRTFKVSIDSLTAVTITNKGSVTYAA